METLKRRLYSEPLYKKSDSATATYLKGRVVGKGLILYVTHAAAEDVTAAPTTIAFGKLIGTRFEAMEEDGSPSAGITYSTEKTHHFTEGEEPTFRFEGAALNDELRGYMEGYYEEVS